MNISFTSRGVGLLALVLIVPAMPAAAQTNTAQKMNQASIQRSWEIQAQVAKIDKDKQTFINNFIASWVPNVDAGLFGDISSELRPLMEAATPWRLYAASLVGDYNGMIQVLRGEVPAGKVIKTLSAAQPHAMATSALTLAPVSPLALGATTSQLVFTPIPPCRIADTRGSGARTGILSPGTPRTFDLTTDAFGKGQGGSTSCTGLPSFSDYAWSVNITLTGYSTTGYLQVYPYSGSVPATSIANFGPALPAIANSSTLTGCYGCSDDINVVASAATHVILDVYGYFEVPTGFATGVDTITEMAGTTATIAAGTYSSVTGGSCPAGTTVIGGAQTNSSSSGNTILTSDHNFSGTSWYEYVKNTGSSAATVTVYSICQDIS
jgi:hypothetical protein